MTIPAGAGNAGETFTLPATNTVNAAGGIFPTGTRENDTTVGSAEIDAVSFGKTVSPTAADNTNGLKYSEFGGWAYINSGAPAQAAVFGVALTPTSGGSVPVTGTS